MAHLANLTINISASPNVTAIDPLIAERARVIDTLTRTIDDGCAVVAGYGMSMAEVAAAMQMTGEDVDALTQQIIATT